MAKDWIMIRVSPETHARLEAARASMKIGHDLGLRELEFDARDRVSLDQIISELLYFRDKHAARRRRANARARARKKKDQAGELGLVPDQAGELKCEELQVNELGLVPDQAGELGLVEQERCLNLRISDTVFVREIESNRG